MIISQAMSGILDFFAQHKGGILVLSGAVFALIVVLQWVCWIFCLGRFNKATRQGTSHQELRFVITDFFVKIIDDFRHLLALVIVFVFLVTLAIMLWPGAKKGDVAMMETSLKVIVATLGNLIAAIIGYYFGESAGGKAARVARQAPSAPEQAPEMQAPNEAQGGPAGVIKAPAPPSRPSGEEKSRGGT